MIQDLPPVYDRSYLAVQLSDSLEEVVITGNVEGLIHLRDQLTHLIERPIPWSHAHFDDWNGLEGNIPHLVIVVKPDDHVIPAAAE